MKMPKIGDRLRCITHSPGTVVTVVNVYDSGYFEAMTDTGYMWVEQIPEWFEPAVDTVCDSAGTFEPNYYLDLMHRAQYISESKAHDYAADNDQHSNFRFSGKLADSFPDWSKPYAVLVGIKLARIAELLKGKSPKNESIEDSFIDLINYCALWGARYLEDRNK